MCWHRWSKWETVGGGSIGMPDNKLAQGEAVIQKRTCQKCNKVDLQATKAWYA